MIIIARTDITPAQQRTIEEIAARVEVKRGLVGSKGSELCVAIYRTFQGEELALYINAAGNIIDHRTSAA